MAKAEKYLYKVFELLLLFTLFFCGLVIFDRASDPFWVVEKFFFKFAVSLLFIVFTAYCFVRKEFPAFKTPYEIVFAVFIAANLLGLIGIPDVYAFIDRFSLNLCCLAFFYMTLYFVNASPAENSRKIFMSAFLGGLIMASYGILQSSGIDFVSWKNTYSGRAASTLGNPNFLAGHMLLLIPAGIAAFIGSKSGIKRILFFLLTAVLTGALIAAQTRGAYIGFAVSLAVLAALFMKYEKSAFKNYRKAAIAAAITMALGIGIYFAANPQAAQRAGDILAFKDEAGRIRAALWKNSLYVIKDHFLTGTGAGNYYITYSFYQSKSLVPADYVSSEYYKSGHAHNDFIQFLAEYGVFGAGAMYLFLAFMILSALKFLKKQEGDRIAVIGIISGAAGIMVHAIFNFPFQIVPTTALFYAFAAVAVSLQGGALIGKGRPYFKYVFACIALAAFVTAGFSARVLASDTYLRKAKESEYFKKPYDAVNYASDAYDLNPWDDETGFFYGKTLDENNNPEKAFVIYKAVYALNPGHWENLNNLFSVYAQKKDIPAMLDVSDKMYRVSPYSIKAIASRAFALYSDGKYDDAIAVYESGIKARGEGPELLSQMAAAYGAKGNIQKTLEYTEKAIAMDPNYTDAYYNLAVAYYRMGNKAGAVETLRKILKITPGDDRAKGFIKVIQDAGKK